MADTISDGYTRVYWVSAISSQAAPTVAELNAGIALTNLITSDGMTGWEATTARVPNTSLASTTDTTRAGRDSFSGPKLRFKEQGVTDAVRSALTKNTQGYIVIRRRVAETTAWTAAQGCAVYPVECHRRSDLPHEDNTMQRFEVEFSVHTPPSYDAVVA